MKYFFKNSVARNKNFQPKLFAIKQGLDPFLTGIILVTFFFGLVALYSATNGNESIVIRQIIHPHYFTFIVIVDQLLNLEFLQEPVALTVMLILRSDLLVKEIALAKVS